MATQSGERHGAAGGRRVGVPVVAAVLAVATVFGSVAFAAVAPSSSAQAVFDVAQARAGLGEFVAANPLLGPGAPVPDAGPRCPLVLPADLQRAAGATGAAVPEDLGGWYGFVRTDADLQSDTGQTVPVVNCVTGPLAAGIVLIALDIGGFDPSSGMTFDRVARRFGVGQVVRVEPPGIGGELVGRCEASGSGSSCTALWHREGS